MASSFWGPSINLTACTLALRAACQANPDTVIGIRMSKIARTGNTPELQQQKFSLPWSWNAPPILRSTDCRNPWDKVRQEKYIKGTFVQNELRRNSMLLPLHLVAYRGTFFPALIRSSTIYNCHIFTLFYFLYAMKITFPFLQRKLSTRSHFPHICILESTWHLPLHHLLSTC